MLRPLGIRVRFVAVPDIGHATGAPGSRIDLAALTTTLPYPDAASFLSRRLGHDVPRAWLRPTVRRAVARAETGLPQRPRTSRCDARETTGARRRGGCRVRHPADRSAPSTQTWMRSLGSSQRRTRPERSLPDQIGGAIGTSATGATRSTKRRGAECRSVDAFALRVGGDSLLHQSTCILLEARRRDDTVACCSRSDGYRFV
jgi:hypothetical protein